MLRTILIGIALAAVSSAVSDVRAQGTYGCLSQGNCGTVIKNKPNDFTHNYVCTNCHTWPVPGLTASPMEIALLSSPARFMPIHDEMAPVARQLYPGTLKSERTLSAESRRMIAEMRTRAAQTRTLTVTVRTVGGAALPANVCVGDATNVARYGRQLASATGQAAYRLMPGVPVRITVSLARFVGTTRSLTTSDSNAGVAFTMAPGTGGPVC